MTPLALVFTLLLCGCVLAAPRRYAALAVFAAVLLLSQSGGISLGGLRMHPGRFLEVAGFIRVMMRGELREIRFGPVDRALLVTYGFLTAIFLIRNLAGLGSSSAAQVVSPLSKVGEFVDVVFVYFMFRGLIRDVSDVQWLLTATLVILLPVSLCLMMERYTSNNPLRIFGAVASPWMDTNDGFRIRCRGAFSHPALLGTFGAWLAVMFVAFVLSPKYRVRGLLGFGLSAVVVILANSGGPLTALMIGGVGWGCWMLRDHMKKVRFGMLIGFILLAIMMSDPIWYLPSKMSSIFGGGGWHRSFLMNQAITHADQWWIAGMAPEMTVSWFPYAAVLGQAADITNLYVAFGIDAGLGAILLLIWLLIVAFREVGTGLRAVEPMHSDDRLLMWAIGCGLLVHAVNYFSITYFDQTQMIWLFQLCAAATVGEVSRARAGEIPDSRNTRGRDPRRSASGGRESFSRRRRSSYPAT